VVTLVLGMLSYVRISPSGITYRSQETWSNEATLVLSQANFPELRSVLPETQQPERFASLVDFYSAFATSDEVIARLQKKGLLKADDLEGGELPVTATAVPSTVNAGPTPLLKLSATAASPGEATRLTLGATAAFINFVRSRQDAAGIPEKQRVELRVVKRSAKPTLVAPRSKTTLIVIFLAGLTVAVAAAFIRDNLRRLPHQQAGEPDAPPALDALRRPSEMTGSRGTEVSRAAAGRPSDLEPYETDRESEAVPGHSARSSG
jgi:hypothetical protein